MAHDLTDASHTAPAARSAGLAFVLGMLFGGIAFFYVMPPRRALPWAVATYAVVALSGLILWVPVFLMVAFLAARAAKLSEGRLAFDGDTTVPQAVGDDMHESRQTPPLSYVRVRGA